MNTTQSLIKKNENLKISISKEIIRIVNLWGWHVNYKDSCDVIDY